MPLYDYVCPQCGETFEIKRSLKDESAEVCPDCECVMEKQFPKGGTFILKGTGWCGKNKKNVQFVEKKK